jgi:hypothetical protein
MANESARGIRGWVYAIAVAACLILIFLASENYARMKQPGFHYAPRTATLTVSTTPKVIPRIATESIPLTIEPMHESIDATAWSNYRSSAQTSISMIDPPAGARLSAPTATSNLTDPFLEAIERYRSPSALASQSAEFDQVAATTVSSTKTTDSVSLPLEMTGRNESNYEKFIGTSVRSNTMLKSNRCWPVSSKIQSELDDLKQAHGSLRDPKVQLWVGEIEDIYRSLLSSQISDTSSKELLNTLHVLSQTGVELASETASVDSGLASSIARLSYSMERRHSVWTAISSCVGNGGTHFISARHHELDSNKLLESLKEVEQAASRTGDALGWRTYLMLDSVVSLANGSIDGKQAQVNLVREFLRRVMDTRVSESQRQFLTSASVHKLADQLHPLSIGPVDYQKMMEDIETLEADPVHRVGKSLADAMQALQFSEHPEQVAISTAVNTHYRNANLRIAVSEDFINRMMPAPTLMDKPVQQNILGSDTRGTSQIATRLKADFLADATAWKIALRLDGDIHSDTKSSRHGMAFYNASNANVTAIREIRISTSGMSINGIPATVDSSDSLRRFSTDWDSLPILGDMVRHFAHEQFQIARPIAKRIMQRTIAKQTDAEFDSQLKSKVASVQGQFDKRLIGPLQSLDLHPMVVDMQTTDTRLVVRYRVASNDQLSAYTPRPIAPSDSQLSLQVHQSVFNNLAGQVVLGDRDWTMQELSDKISDLLQQPHSPLDAETPTDINIRFNDARPITVEFEDGRLWLTLRVASLEQPGRIHLKNFVIRTSYLPDIAGLKANLVRDGVVSVDGHKLGMRDRLPLRAIFSRVFSNRATIPMVSEDLLHNPKAVGLAVSQLEMRDGWLAMAVSNEASPHVALLKSNQAALNR